METTIIVLAIIGILISMVVGFFWGVSHQRKNCRTCRSHDLNTELKQASNTVIWLYDQLGVAKELRHEKECKESLMDFIHSNFFFREYEDAKNVYKDLERRRDEHQNYNRTYPDERNCAIAEMYQTLIKNINPRYLEDN